jgi:putative ABC transport system permease protein
MRQNEVLIPFTLYETHFRRNARERVDEVIFMLKDNRYVRRVQSELLHAYRRYHRGAEDVQIETSLDKIKDMEAASWGLKVVFWAIAAISLVVGGISIMNIMFATIGNRIREIGLRKALGAQPLDVFLQYLIEAILISCVGGIPGMLLGACINFTPPGIFPYDPRLQAGDFVLAISFIIAAGIVSGLFPALKASRMQPVEALRY